jgi:hypothetical protein
MVEGTSSHYLKALRLLRERLCQSDESAKISDSTITVVIALAVHARVTRDYEAARHHMEGILKIADLRGGLASISARPMLALEVFRYVLLPVGRMILRLRRLTSVKMRPRYSARERCATPVLYRAI